MIAANSSQVVVVPLTEEDAHPPRRSRRGLMVGLAAAALVAGGGTGALADAHKTVTLDVDGHLTHVSTFAGSVAGVLEQQGVRLSKNDAVVPARAARLHDGADVVVRYGRQVTFDADGLQTTAWVAALDADDALDALASRGSDVRLVASRSGDRLSLPLPLAPDGGKVAVVADGRTRTFTDPGTGVDALLRLAGLTVDADDVVSVVPAPKSAPDARVALAVQRVQTKDQQTRTPIPFKRVRQQDPQRYADSGPKVVQAGADGLHVRVERVTTVDGVVTERLLLSDADVTAPVDQVVAIGTKERPVAAPPEPRQTTAPSGPAAPAAQAPAAPVPAAAPAPTPAAPSGDVWAALAQCESGGRVDAVSSNGLYYGLYQFTVSTWQAMGGSGLPSQASAAEQTQRAQALQARSGWGQWPACARKLGLL